VFHNEGLKYKRKGYKISACVVGGILCAFALLQLLMRMAKLHSFKLCKMILNFDLILKPARLGMWGRGEKMA